MAGEGVGGGVGSGVPPAATFRSAMENEGDGGGLMAPVGVVGFVREQIVESFQSAEQFGAGIEVGRPVSSALVEVVAIRLGEAQCFPVGVVFD